MALKTFRPLTPAARFKALPDFAEITKSKPEKSLLEPIKKSGGRNNNGRITSRHRGGGHKRMYRVIDFKRTKRDVVADVIAIEYDPNRTARIALLQYPDGEKAYILAPAGLNVGAKVVAGNSVEAATPFRSSRFRSAQAFTTSNSSRAAAARSFGAPVPKPSSTTAKPATPS